MKNSQKIEAANKLTLACRNAGFTNAFVRLIDEAGDEYDTPEELAQQYGDGDTPVVTLSIVLDPDFTFTVTADDDTDEATVEYAD